MSNTTKTTKYMIDNLKKNDILFNSKKYGIAIKRITFNYKKGVWLMKVLKLYAPTDQQEITDIALHYVFEAEPGAKEYTIFASENPDFVNGMELTV